ncbi:hypothetical protein DPMN_151119 [Dreissena polymorpha]|uniref:Uncharacterized protein n=1 Tax=Dreissena polymorpha TaxID=45954 RepID=A0A9D4J6M9_DREPO|nr:hypothetical protein DPMN_151119 [Dreissena polymorpha]
MKIGITQFYEKDQNNVLSEANASMSEKERQQMGLQSWPMFPHQLNDIPVNRSQPTHLSENYQNYGMSETTRSCLKQNDIAESTEVANVSTPAE